MNTLASSLSAWALILTVGACTDPAEPPPTMVTSKLEIGMRATIPAGTEVEYCQFVTVPETWVTKDAIGLAAASHHVLIYQTPYAQIPTQRLDGTPVDTSGVFDCSDGPTNGWSVTKLVGGSQNRTGESILAFPEGVGVRIDGILLMNVHYRNASDTPLEVDVKVAFDTASADEIAQEGDVMFLYNPLISVPPGGTSTARWRCPVYQDITISNVQSHMHAHSVGYEARVDGGAPFYVNDRWEGVPVQTYDDLTVKAGSVLDFHCDYRNTGSTPVYQGRRTTDEMCVLVGSFYPADPRTASCLDPTGKLPGGDWVGQGTASCAQTLGCLQAAMDLPAMSDCMAAAAPAVAHESSELLRCFLGAKDPMSQCSAQIQMCSQR